LRKGCFLLARETDFTNGLNLAYAMVRMMDGISLINNDSFLPGCCLVVWGISNMISMLHESSLFFNGNMPATSHKAACNRNTPAVNFSNLAHQWLILLAADRLVPIGDSDLS